MTRQWSINGRFLTQTVTGVQRYAREIVTALDRAIVQDHPLTRDLALDLVVPVDAPALPRLEAIRLVRKGRAHGHLWEQIILPRGLKGGLLSLGNAGPLALRRQIVCLHDVTTRLVPRSHAPAYRAAQRIALPLLGRTSATVATVSSYSASRLLEYGICSRDKLVVVPNGHEHVFRWRPSPVAANGGSERRDAVLLIGTPAPHKNFGIVLGLADQLHAAGLRILVIGARDPAVYRTDNAAAAHPAITWLGRVPDDALPTLLRQALCLAFPSLEEGFGLPPLEAMALGCPVVVSDRASLPELCGDSALYAPPRDADAWLRCFLRLRDDLDLRRRLTAAGRTRAALFSWEASAELYLQRMRAIDEAMPLSMSGNSAP